MRRKYVLLALAPLVLLAPTGAEAVGGTASFSPFINWKSGPDLYFNVNGAPASVCGDLHVSRNGGAYTVTTGWICTDGSGNASKGPWTWANQIGDEDAYAYIVWPDSTSTNTAHHIWDKTAPSITINSFGSTPPTSFTGSANDGSYGAGFKADFGQDSGVSYPNGSKCFVQFKDLNSGLYWCSGNSYSSSVACTVSCTISGMPARSVTWSADQVPPSAAYNPMDSYQWTVIIYDNYQLGQRTQKDAPPF
jgi:hypothetical protein